MILFQFKTKCLFNKKKVNTNSNFEKVVGNDDKVFDQNDFEQFKRKPNLNENSKTSQFLKVRILCKGEFFGEEEILKNQPRQYRIVCNSYNGKALMIKKDHFLNHIFSDEVSKQYILNRIKDKTSKIEQRIQNIKNSLKDFKQFLYHDKSLTKQQILQKNLPQQAQLKFDEVFDSHDIINKFIDQNLIRVPSDDKTDTSLRGNSQTRLKESKTLNLVSSMPSLNSTEKLDPSSPLKSQQVLQKQNTAIYNDIYPSSPPVKQQSSKFQPTQFINNFSKQQDTSSTRTYDMYAFESPEKLGSSPIFKKDNKDRIIKQLNLVNQNSPGSFQQTYKLPKGFQSMTDMSEQKQKKQNDIFPIKPESQINSLTAQDEHIQYDELNLKIKSKSKQEETLKQKQIIQPDCLYNRQMSLSQIDEKTEQNQYNQENQQISKKRLNQQIFGQFDILNNSQTNTETINSTASQQKRENYLQQQKDNDNQSQQKVFCISSSQKRKQFIGQESQSCNDLQNNFKSGSIDRVKVKLQLKTGLSNDFSQQDGNKIKNQNDLQYKDSQSSTNKQIRHQSTCINFNTETSQNNQQKSFNLTHRILNPQIKANSNQTQSQLNLFQVLDHTDQNLLQRQLLQKTNQQWEMIKQKSSTREYLREWRQRNQSNDNQIENQRKSSNPQINQNQNKKSRSDIKLIDDITTMNNIKSLQDLNNQRNESPTKSSHNLNTLYGNFNSSNIISTDKELSPYLKKKLKKIVRMKNLADSELIKHIVEQKSQLFNKQNPIIVKHTSDIQDDIQNDINQNQENASINKFPTQKTNRLQFRKSSYDSINCKTQRLMSPQSQNILTNENQTDSFTLQGSSSNKKKTFLNMMSQSQVQSQFQKQVQSQNKINQIQPLQLQPLVQPNQTSKQNYIQENVIDAEQKMSLDDRKRKTFHSGVDPQIKRSENDMFNQTKQQKIKLLPFQLDTQSPIKSMLQTERNTNSSALQLQNLQALTLTSSQSVDNTYSSNIIKLTQSQLSQRNKILQNQQASQQSN